MFQGNRNDVFAYGVDRNFRYFLAAKGSFQAGQTAKALSGYRVQSLPQWEPSGIRLQNAAASIRRYSR
jgi:hypothetical protein